MRDFVIFLQKERSCCLGLVCSTVEDEKSGPEHLGTPLHDLSLSFFTSIDAVI